jgi:hypothetical protein
MEYISFFSVLLIMIYWAKTKTLSTIKKTQNRVTKIVLYARILTPNQHSCVLRVYYMAGRRKIRGLHMHMLVQLSGMSIVVTRRQTKQIEMLVTVSPNVKNGQLQTVQEML